MEKTTPMLKQYHSIKAKHKECILFFRLGDFYEMFYEDAKVASSILDLVLTSRGKDNAGKIPMCGIPYHAADNYIAKLIKAGQKVAICEQVEDPSASKGIVKRDVVRTITSGTFIDDQSNDSRYLLALSPNKTAIGIAFIDTATGTIHTNQYPDPYKTIELIAKLPVYECIFPEADEEKVKSMFDHPILKSKRIALSSYQDWCFNSDIAKKTLCEHFATHNLRGFGIEDLNLAQSSCGGLLEYLKQMNRQPLRHIDKLSLYADNQFVFISPAAQYGLELELLRKTLDHTLTPMGKRMFRFWLYHPLRNPPAILQRQYAVTLLKERNDLHEELTQQLLRNIPDMEKSLSRLSYGYMSVKDILSIRNCLDRLPQIIKAIYPLNNKNSLFTLDDVQTLRELLEQIIAQDVPLGHYEGKVIKKGYHKELDDLRNIQENGQQWLKKLQAEEIKRTGINSLKIGFNKVFGYYIEITKANTHLAPHDYIRKQTLVNAERYITPQLKEFEEKILTAKDKVIAIEQEILQTVQKEILKNSINLHNLCNQLATIDCLCSLATLAKQEGYVNPEINDSNAIYIKDGRHPMVEQTCVENFTPNDLLLDDRENHLIILTGPNMSGKSTYIRQSAILVIMAQMGSYIPASQATIGAADKIFTRIGAHDDITKAQSTFMVEMTEAADILNNLTPKSLVILDEIGRGTSTFDGLSLAWALAEHLQNEKTRTLFATHFHELTALANEHQGTKNYNVAVKEWKDKIIFLHKIIPGGTDDSYGIYVAKLAGIPEVVIKRSRQILTQLEMQENLKEKISNKIPKRETQLPLFSKTTTVFDEEALAIKEAVEKIDLENTTPIEALNKLQELKNLVNSD